MNRSESSHRVTGDPRTARRIDRDVASDRSDNDEGNCTMFWHMLQLAGYLIAAALVGLGVGWLIWARRSKEAQKSFEERAKVMRAELMAHRSESSANRSELERLRRLTTNTLVGGADNSGASDASDTPGATGTPGATDAQDDDLTRIEGIGPKMAAALHTAGLGTFGRLADATEETLGAAIEAAGMSFAPSLTTWARQARFLVDGDESGFKEYTDHLVAGREPEAD